MRIHREGYRIIVSVFAILVVASALITANVDSKIPQFIMYAVSIFFFYFIVRFFRVPKRRITKDENAIFSPADGKVVVIEEIFEDKYFHEKRLKISIFMSAFNVHVNSYPISGNIKQVDYYPGKHMIAWYPKSSDFNEHSVLSFNMPIRKRF
jgi:phosphatidylserine decarboxylase